MSLNDLGSLGEFIGALAVVVSLIYLAIQVRQNTRALFVSTGQAQADSHSHYLLQLAKSDRLSALSRPRRRTPRAPRQERRLGLLAFPELDISAGPGALKTALDPARVDVAALAPQAFRQSVEGPTVARVVLEVGAKYRFGPLGLTCFE